MRNKILIHLAGFFLFYDAFPFEKFGLGSPKPLSLIFIILFFLCNWDHILRLKFKKIDLLFIIGFVILVGISFSVSITQNFFLENSLSFLYEVILLIIVYLSLKLYIYKITDKKLLHFILYGYCFNNIFGILQLVYIISPVDKILEINKLLLNSTHHLQNNRVQFLFGEPSMISLHITLVILPILMFFQRKNIKINLFIKVNILILIIIGCFSASMRYFLDLIIWSILYIFYYNRKYLKFFIHPLTICILVLILFSILTIIQANLDNLFLLRIKNNLSFNKDNSVLIRDISTWARYDYSLVAFNSFFDYPITGYGGGNYINAFRKNLPRVDVLYYLNPELVYVYNNFTTLSTINMYARIICEFGLIGIIFFISLIIKLFKVKDKILKISFIFILYYFIQSDSLLNIPILSILILTMNYREVYKKTPFH